MPTFFYVSARPFWPRAADWISGKPGPMKRGGWSMAQFKEATLTTGVECAIEDKQAWAFQQIADRLEGKPVQVVDATVDDNRTLHEFSDAELSAILRRRVGVVPVESEEDRPVG